MVNETLARTVWPGRSAVGQRLLHQERDGVETPIEVVGVAADAKYRYISDAPEPFLFVPMAQHPIGDVTLFVGHAPGAAPDAALRAAVAQVEPSVPVMFVQSFDDAVAIGLTPQRLTAWVAGSVGLAGVGLAALGLYGLMAFLVAQRTRELAIRMALGASAGRLQGQVLGQAARLGAAGAAVGLVLAAGVGVLLRSLLVGVASSTCPSAVAAALLFLAVLAGASWVPARRAATDQSGAARCAPSERGARGAPAGCHSQPSRACLRYPDAALQSSGGASRHGSGGPRARCACAGRQPPGAGSARRAPPAVDLQHRRSNALLPAGRRGRHAGSPDQGPDEAVDVRRPQQLPHLALPHRRQSRR